MPTIEECRAVRARIGDRVLKRAENEFDSGYSGSSFYEKNSAITLYEDMSLMYEERSFTSLSAGGFSLPQESSARIFGSWYISDQGDYPQLILKDENNDIFKIFSVMGNGSSAVENLDGVLWNRYLIS